MFREIIEKHTETGTDSETNDDEENVVNASPQIQEISKEKDNLVAADGFGGLLNMPPVEKSNVRQTKYKLPVLHWRALKPNQIQGTIFNELDDEQIQKIYSKIF